MHIHKTTFFICSILTLAMGYYYIWNPFGFVAQQALHNEIVLHKNKNHRLKKTITYLKHKIFEIQNNPNAYQEIARTDYGMGYTSDLVFLTTR